MDDEIRQSDTGGFIRAAKNDSVLRFRASTDAIDRHKSIVIQKGINFKNFSGAFLWGHDSFKGMFGGGPEIKNNLGKVVAKKRTKFMRGSKPAEATDIEVKFSEANPFAVMAEGMVREGVLGNTSIAFIPDANHMRTEVIKKQEVRIFDKVELLEISLVPVPSNPEAQALVRSMSRELGEEIIEIPDMGVQRRTDENGDWFWVEGRWSHRISAEHRPIDDLLGIRGIVPANVSTTKAAENTRWSAPALKDFTDKTWTDLTVRERRRIMGHFAWTPSSDPEEFGFSDMKLPHHSASNGAIVLRGVNAAMGALLGARGGVDLPGEDRRKVYNHLAAHIRSFDRVPPPFRSADDPPPKGADLGSVGQIVSQTVKTWIDTIRSG